MQNVHRKWTARTAHQYARQIKVRLCDGSAVPETSVNIANIEEDMLGRDVVTFKCPRCGCAHRSLRFG